MQNEKTHSHTFVWCSMKETKWKLKFIVSNVVLWPKYINANGKRCGCRFRVEDKTPFFFHLYIYSNLSFLNSSISRWFLNTFFDLSTNQPRKKSRRTKSFFSPLRWSMQKRTFNCLLYHSFFSSLFFYLFSIFTNLVQLSSRYYSSTIIRERWGQYTFILSHRCLIFILWNRQSNEIGYFRVSLRFCILNWIPI